MSWNRWATLLLMSFGLFAVVSACSQNKPSSPTEVPTNPMAGQMALVQPQINPPPVKGFYKGQEVWFIHTEASDAKVVDMLTAMMNSRVLLVPKLNSVPESSLADVFVFTNGVPGGGPFGFQPDVFDLAPGDEGYSPLRAVNLVAWQEGVSPRELRSAEAVKDATAKGEITITHPGVVVNMPMLTWPGGHR
jgi:hypothetical protein